MRVFPRISSETSIIERFLIHPARFFDVLGMAPERRGRRPGEGLPPEGELQGLHRPEKMVQRERGSHDRGHFPHPDDRGGQEDVLPHGRGGGALSPLRRSGFPFLPREGVPPDGPRGGEGFLPLLRGFLGGVSISPTLEVTPCVSLPLSLGNLGKESLSSFWEKGIRKEEGSKLGEWQSVTIGDLPDCYRHDYCRWCRYCSGMGIWRTATSGSPMSSACRRRPG